MADRATEPAAGIGLAALRSTAQQLEREAGVAGVPNVVAVEQLVRVRAAMHRRSTR